METFKIPVSATMKGQLFGRVFKVELNERPCSGICVFLYMERDSVCDQAGENGWAEVYITISGRDIRLPCYNRITNLIFFKKQNNMYGVTQSMHSWMVAL